LTLVSRIHVKLVNLDPKSSMTQRTINLSDAAATQAVGVELGKSLTAGSVILLTGELGSGKTTLVQGLAQGLGIVDPIVSPTFTIINEYFSGRLPLYHLDLYRLDPAEVDELNVDTYWQGIETEPGIMAIEWAERLSYLPPTYLRVELSYDPIDGRIAKISSGD
jgi:tRNA threonylcarbamoyladenosine biosynthesis protein TsaE